MEKEKENKKYQLFSNATEFMVWQENNCEKCIKAVWYNEKTNTYPKYRCAVQRNIELASVTDGCGTQRDHEATKKTICPYRQTERNKSNNKQIDKNQLNLGL